MNGSDVRKKLCGFVTVNVNRHSLVQDVMFICLTVYGLFLNEMAVFIRGYSYSVVDGG